MHAPAMPLPNIERYTLSFIAIENVRVILRHGFKCPRSCNHSITIFSTRTARGRISALATLSNARKTGRENRIDVGGGFVIFFIVSIPVVFRTLRDDAVTQRK